MRRPTMSPIFPVVFEFPGECGNLDAVRIHNGEDEKVIIHSTTAMMILLAGISPLIILLLLLVLVVPFVLPPVKSWRTATPAEKVSVVLYALAVIVLMLYFMVSFNGPWP